MRYRCKPADYALTAFSLVVLLAALMLNVLDVGELCVPVGPRALAGG